MKISVLTLLLLIIFSIPASAQTNKLPRLHKYMTTTDLNGDGKKDKISLKKKESKHILKINDQIIEFIADDDQIAVNGFTIRDLDTSDKFIEVLIPYVGGNDNFRYQIYRYDGAKIHHIGHAYSLWMQMPILHKKGLVISKDHMGFWSLNELYKINQKTHKLEVTPQDLYYVGNTYHIKCEQPIYAKKGSSVVIDTLYPNTRAQVLLFDSELDQTKKKNESDSHYKGWYLIKTENDILGWLKEDKMRYECFDGLVMAG